MLFILVITTCMNILFYFFYLFPSSGCTSSKSEDRLFRRLFRRYNQFIRPVENVSDPVTVEFEVSISQLVKVVRVNGHHRLVHSFTSSPVINHLLLFSGCSESDHGDQSLAETCEQLLSLSQVTRGARSFRQNTSVCFRSGMTTNSDGSLWSMMGLNTYGFHLIRFGGLISFCITSEFKDLHF